MSAENAWRIAMEAAADGEREGKVSDPEDNFHEPAVKEGYGHEFYPVRWHPYKPKHTAQTGRKGRWQRTNEYGGWDNCKKPALLFETHHILDELTRLRADLAAAQERERALREALYAFPVDADYPTASLFAKAAQEWWDARVVPALGGWT